MRKALIALSLSVVMLTVGCTTAWLNTFDGYLKVAGPVLIQILDIVALARGIPVSAQLVAKIQADQAAVEKLATSVKDATGQNVQGTCAAFNQGVQTFAGDLSSIEQLAQIDNPIKQQEIATLIQLAQQTIAEVEAPIAACQSAPNNAAALKALQTGVYQLKGPNDVVRRFNALVDSKHRVHLHSKVSRTLSFGRLQ